MTDALTEEVKQELTREIDFLVSLGPYEGFAAERIMVCLKRASAALASLPPPAEGVDARVGLQAAIHAAKLALFVINKRGVMPNSSWESGFNKDLATAEDVLSRLEGGEREGWRPVAWLCNGEGDGWKERNKIVWCEEDAHAYRDQPKRCWKVQPLYAGQPLPAAPVKEPTP